MEIIPAILPKNFAELEEKCSFLAGEVATVQIDICDGKFVPSKSWPYEGDSGEFEKAKKEGKLISKPGDLDLETHLMVKNPKADVGDWVKVGAKRIIIHIEAGSDVVHDIIEEWGHVVEIGLAVELNTPLSSLESYFDKVNVIQLMGIEKVGFQGQAFDSTVLDRIVELRRLGFTHTISVDGGVNESDADSIVRAGADRLVVGSALWKGVQ